jgi:hypothetical protein
VNHMSALLASGKHSAPVTDIGQRIIWTIVILAVLAGIYLLMWRGWKKRQARQADVLPLHEVPDGVFCGDGIESVYVSTTTAGDWLDRIAVHGLGNRCDADVAVAPEGVLIERATYGQPDVFIPAAAIQNVRLDSGMAGKYLGKMGLVVVTWSHGDRTLDTGVDTRRDADRAILVEAIEKIRTGPALTGPAGTNAQAAQTEGTTP